MRVMLDANVLLAVAACKSKGLRVMLDWICQEHQLVLCAYVIDECYEVVHRKKPALIPALDRFFEAIPFESVHTPETLPKHNEYLLRDADDEKVLYSAITAAVDVLATGDNNFSTIDVEKPDILTPRRFMEKRMLM